MAVRVSVREISNEEGQRLLRLVRRGSGSVVTWRRAQLVLLSAQGMDVAAIAKVSFTSPDRVRDVIHNFNPDGFDSLRPKCAGGRPPKFTLPQRTEIKKVALGRPADRGLPFSTWSLPKPSRHTRAPTLPPVGPGLSSNRVSLFCLLVRMRPSNVMAKAFSPRSAASGMMLGASR